MKNWLYGVFIFSSSYSANLIQGTGYTPEYACHDARQAMPSAMWHEVGGAHIRCAYPTSGGACDSWHVCTIPVSPSAR